MNLLREAVASDGAMSGEEAVLYARGLYYLNGGTKQGFDSFNEEDIAMMLAVDEGMRAREAKMHLAMMGKAMRCRTTMRSSS